MVDAPDPSDEAVPDLGPVPSRLTIDAALVRRLVDEQFPCWSHLPVRPVQTPGWDNATFHLGDELAVRLPSAAAYALAVEKEHRWLPWLAERLPVRIPMPLERGRPGAGYPFDWTVYRWIPGVTAPPAPSVVAAGLASFVAAFVAALRAADPTGGPRPGIHNWFRGATLRTYDATAREAIDDLTDQVDTQLAAEAWEHALAARWEGTDVWFHGDLAPDNLLLDGGRLTAVIDFGTCGVGDPACDLAIGWTVLDAGGRATLREQLAVGEAEWSRGRGWALWKSLNTASRALASDDTAEAATALHVVGAVLDDYLAAT